MKLVIFCCCGAATINYLMAYIAFTGPILHFVMQDDADVHDDVAAHVFVDILLILFVYLMMCC